MSSRNPHSLPDLPDGVLEHPECVLPQALEQQLQDEHGGAADLDRLVELQGLLEVVEDLRGVKGGRFLGDGKHLKCVAPHGLFAVKSVRGMGYWNFFNHFCFRKYHCSYVIMACTISYFCKCRKKSKNRTYFRSFHGAPITCKHRQKQQVSRSFVMML